MGVHEGESGESLLGDVGLPWPSGLMLRGGTCILLLLLGGTCCTWKGSLAWGSSPASFSKVAGSGDWLLGGWKCPDKGNVTPGLQQSLHCHPLPLFLIASCVLLGQFSFYSSFQGSVCSSMKASPTISACHSYSAKHMASGLKERQLRASKHQLEQKCRPRNTCRANMWVCISNWIRLYESQCKLYNGDWESGKKEGTA